MKYNFLEKALLLIMLYSDLFYLKYKWNCDNVSVRKTNPNKYFQPILYRLSGFRKNKVELGLLILETYSHFIAVIVLVETIFSYILNTSFLKPIVLFSFWLLSGIFVTVYLITNSMKDKNK